MRQPLTFPCVQTLDGLPNCVFDASTPLRQYSIQSRIGGFLAKFAELSAVGAVAGGATSIMSAAGRCPYPSLLLFSLCASLLVLMVICSPPRFLP